jgi:hypothetical protein
MAATTWGESVLCFPRSFTHPRSRALRQDHIKKATFCLMCQQTTAKFTPHRNVEAWICYFQAESVFPIDARPDGVGCLSIR